MEWKGTSPDTKLYIWGRLGPDFRGTEKKKAFPGNVSPDKKFNISDRGTSSHGPVVEKIL